MQTLATVSRYEYDFTSPMSQGAIYTYVSYDNQILTQDRYGLNQQVEAVL